MKGDDTYQTPTIETMSAEHILELLGPVSCGSQKPGGTLSAGSDELIPVKPV